VLLDPGTRPELRLEFSIAEGARKSAHVIRVNQIAPLGEGQTPMAMTDVGGVEYQVTIR
jgi:hypothetical protein